MKMGISTVVTDLILMSLWIILFCPLMRRSRVLLRTGFGWSLAVFLLISARLLLPIEFGYTYSLYFTKVFTSIRMFLTYRLAVGGAEVSVCQLLLVLWAGGFLLISGEKWWAYRRLRRFVRLCSPAHSQAAVSAMAQASEAFPELKGIRMVVLPFVNTPVLMGFFKKTIILPSIDFTVQELEYILKHEGMHIRTKDILWKSILDVLCTLYWWYPLVKYMKNCMFELLEIRNDRRLTAGMTVREKEDYLDCLARIARSCGFNIWRSISGSCNVYPADSIYELLSC